MCCLDLHLVELSTNVKWTKHFTMSLDLSWVKRNTKYPDVDYVFSNPISFPRWFNVITLIHLVEMMWKQRWFVQFLGRLGLEVFTGSTEPEYPRPDLGPCPKFKLSPRVCVGFCVIVIRSRVYDRGGKMGRYRWLNQSANTGLLKAQCTNFSNLNYIFFIQIFQGVLQHPLHCYFPWQWGLCNYSW